MQSPLKFDLKDFDYWDEPDNLLFILSNNLFFTYYICMLDHCKEPIIKWQKENFLLVWGVIKQTYVFLLIKRYKDP